MTKESASRLFLALLLAVSMTLPAAGCGKGGQETSGVEDIVDPQSSGTESVKTAEGMKTGITETKAPFIPDSGDGAAAEAGKTTSSALILNIVEAH